MSIVQAAKLVLVGRGLGYMPSPEDARDHVYSAPRLDELVRPANFSLEPHAVARRDQLASNTCVAHGFAHAIAIRENLMGLAYEPLSVLSMHATSCAYHGGKHSGGTYPRTMMKGLAQVGAPPESVWPFDLSNLNKHPPPQAYLRGDARRGGTYQRITETGNARIEALCGAVADGLPVAIGTLVDRGIVPLKGSRLLSRPVSAEKAIGGHLMCVIGYRDHGARFEVLNSYGRSWRDDGICEIEADYVAWEQTQDLVIIDAWRGLTKAVA